MKENDIYRTTYARVSRDKSVAIPLTYGDLERIIACFKENDAAFSEFLEFADMWRNEPDRVPPRYSFWEVLRGSINRFVRVDCDGAVFPPDPGFALESAVLEELLRRQGIAVEWGPKPRREP